MNERSETPNVGNRITAYRTARGLSQAELADVLGVTAETVAAWELGSADPNAAQVEKLDELLAEQPDAAPATKRRSQRTRIVLAVCVMAVSIVLIALGIALACTVEPSGVAPALAVGERAGYIATACLGAVALVLAAIFMALGLKRKK